MVPPNCTILESWVFENFILAHQLFAKVLQGLQTCASVNNNLCENLCLSLEPPTTFDEKFKVNSV